MFQLFFKKIVMTIENVSIKTLYKYVAKNSEQSLNMTFIASQCIDSLPFIHSIPLVIMRSLNFNNNKYKNATVKC